MIGPTPRHKVFVSFHHDDQEYKDYFVEMMEGDIVDKSVEDGDIDDTNLSTETIRQKIRDDFIADATVTVVLIGPCTCQRKHVDWEIGSSLRATSKNPRCGLLGILLPTHPNNWIGLIGSGLPNLPNPEMVDWRPELIPPRLADNCNRYNPESYARLYRWTDNTALIRAWIHRAFQRRDGTPPPDNSRLQFKNNRSGSCSVGWRD